MKSAGIWLTVLMRGVQLKSLTHYHWDTTARLFHIYYYQGVFTFLNFLIFK